MGFPFFQKKEVKYTIIKLKLVQIPWNGMGSHHLFGWVSHRLDNFNRSWSTWRIAEIYRNTRISMDVSKILCQQNRLILWWPKRDKYNLIAKLVPQSIRLQVYLKKKKTLLACVLKVFLNHQRIFHESAKIWKKIQKKAFWVFFF